MRLPGVRKRLHQPGHGQRRWLMPVEDGFDDLGFEQGKSQDAADLGWIDALDAGDFVDSAMDANLQ